MKYNHIIWDWNGTLFDDAELCLNIINKLLSKRNLQEISHQQYQEVFDFPVKNYYKKIGFDFEREPFEIVAREFINEYNKHSYQCSLRTDAPSLLQTISEKNITQSILSAMSQDGLHDLINYFQIEEYFTDIVGLNNHYADGKIGNGKRWIQETDYEKSDILLIGDTVHDYEVAEEMGIDSMLCYSGHQAINKLESCRVPVIKYLNEILEYI